MSDTEKLTIAQKIDIARMAVDIYMTEYPSGHTTLLTKREAGGDKPMSRVEIAVAADEQRASDIRNDFLNIYKAVESAITGDSGNQK